MSFLKRVLVGVMGYIWGLQGLIYYCIIRFNNNHDTRCYIARLNFQKMHNAIHCAQINFGAENSVLKEEIPA